MKESKEETMKITGAIKSIYLLLVFPITIPLYCIMEKDFFRGIIRWLEHIFYGFYGRFWEEVKFSRVKDKIEIKLL